VKVQGDEAEYVNVNPFAAPGHLMAPVQLTEAPLVQSVTGVLLVHVLSNKAAAARQSAKD
jgi:hypothetical protein